MTQQTAEQQPSAQQSSAQQSSSNPAAQPTSGQQPNAQGTEELPVFRSTSNLVLVPTVVRDRQGKHIAGLTKDMFKLEENKKQQTISFFEEITPSEADAAPYPAPDLGYSNLPFAESSRQSLTIIVLDLLSTRAIQREDGKRLLTGFLAQGLPRGQMVSIVSITSKGLQSIHPFSTDTGLLMRALQNTPIGAETIMARANVVDTTIGAITDIGQAYAGVPGRKSMIFAAGNITELISGDQIVDSSPVANALRRMWRGLIEANISVYPISLMERVVNLERVAPGQEFAVNRFADATGASPCVETNDVIGCLAEAVDDSRSYYMLGFSVQPDDRKPGWRDLKVKVSAEHASVYARNGFYYGTPNVEQAKRPDEIKALASALPISAVPVFVKVLGVVPPGAGSTPAAVGKKTIAFKMTIPLTGVFIDPASREPLDIEVGAIAMTRDGKGPKEAGEFIQPVKGNPKPENLQAWARYGMKLDEKLELPTGSYDVRFFARDNNSGKIGTVVFPLDVN